MHRLAIYRFRHARRQGACDRHRGVVANRAGVRANEDA
jgi:hypothetical protein